jgi:4-amino-4-deoxy-L-arabinose transferase-like glycosyltransferase
LKDTTLLSPKTIFALAFIVTFALKLWLAYVVPVTGDEALFFWWGTYLNWGYYDHPPMVGWMIGFLKLLGESPLVLRLFTVAVTFLVALGIVDLVGRLAPEQGNAKWVAATLYLLVPITWFGVPVTNDTPLILFLCLSAYFFIRGEVDQPAVGFSQKLQFKRGFWWFLASGLAFGFAFLSKYLAIVLFIAFAITLLRPRRWGGKGLAHAVKALLTITLAALPFGLLNLAYNATNCWNNVMFNAINRHDDAGVGIENLGLYLFMMIYLLTPWLLWGLWKSRANLGNHRAVLLLAIVPTAFFLVLSVMRSVGLHWVLGFLPLFYVLAGTLLANNRLLKYQNWAVLFCLPHVVLAVGFFAFSNFWLSKNNLGSGIGFVYDAKNLPAIALAGAPEGTILMAEGYSPASVLGYHARRYVPVFGVGSRYARQDDFHVDFRALNGKPVRILLRKDRPLSEFSSFFETVRSERLEVNGRPYWVIQGEGFIYDEYRKSILTEIARRFYQIPPILPVLSCPFIERYGLQGDS